MAYARRTPNAHLQPVAKGQKITADYINKLRREIRHVDETLQDFGADPASILTLPCVNKDAMYIPAYSVVEIFGGSAANPMRYVRRPTEHRLQNVGFTVMGMKPTKPGHVLTGGFMMAKVRLPGHVFAIDVPATETRGKRCWVERDSFDLRLSSGFRYIDGAARNDGAFLVVGLLWKDAVNNHPPWLPDPGEGKVWAIVKQFDFALDRIGVMVGNWQFTWFWATQHISFLNASVTQMTVGLDQGVVKVTPL